MRRLTVLAGRRSRMHARTHAHTHARTHARTHSLTHSCTCIVLHSNRAHNSTPPAHSLPSSSLLFIPLSPHVVALGRPAMAALQLEAERGAGIKSRPLGRLSLGLLDLVRCSCTRRLHGGQSITQSAITMECSAVQRQCVIC